MSLTAKDLKAASLKTRSATTKGGMPKFAYDDDGGREENKFAINSDSRRSTEVGRGRNSDDDNDSAGEESVLSEI
jgi:hypothetical protein